MSLLNVPNKNNQSRIKFLRLFLLSGLLLLALVLLILRLNSDKTPVRYLELPDIVNAPVQSFDNRRGNQIIDAVVLIVFPDRDFKTVFNRMAQARNRFSVHYTINTSGVLFSHVTEDKRAWHTPYGRFPDTSERVMNRSIAIGLTRIPGKPALYNKEQVTTLKALLRQLQIKYPLKFIVTESQVALLPRTDFFDFDFPFDKFPEISKVNSQGRFSYKR